MDVAADRPSRIDVHHRVEAGTALDVTEGLRFGLDVEVGAAQVSPEFLEGLAMRLTWVFAAQILVSFQAASGQTPLTLVGATALLGVECRIDHLAVDTASERLYVVALANNTAEAFDLKGSSQAALTSR